MRYSILLIFIFIISSINETKGQEITIWPGLWGQQYYQDYKRITKADAEILISADQVASKE